MPKTKDTTKKVPENVKRRFYFPPDVIDIIFNNVKPYSRIPFYAKVVRAKYQADGNQMIYKGEAKGKATNEIGMDAMIDLKTDEMLNSLVEKRGIKMVRSNWLSEAIREFYALPDTTQQEIDEELLQSNQELVGKRMLLIIDGKFSQGFPIEKADLNRIYVQTPYKRISFYTPLQEMNAAVDADKPKPVRKKPDAKAFYVLETRATRSKYKIK